MSNKNFAENQGVHIAVFGAGAMGRYTAKALAPEVKKISIYDPFVTADKLEKHLQGISYQKVDSIESAVKDANYVIFCVPTDKVYELMLKALPHCKKGVIISGQTSRKTPETEAFDMYKKQSPDCGLELVTIHTMCDPEKSNPYKEILGVIKHNPDNDPTYEGFYEQAKKFYGGMSEHIEVFESVSEHDTITSRTQIDTSRTFLTIASSFAKVRCFPWLDKNYGSSFDVMKFALAMRAASLPNHVYRNIQLGSQYGKIIVSKSIEVEEELYRMRVGNRKDEYKTRVMNAKRIIFGEKEQEPILSDGTMKMFDKGGEVLPNSDFSIIQYAVATAESERNPFKDLKATTPMHTSLLCLMDRLFNTEKLEEAIEAAFDPKLKEDDLVFHNEIQGWANAILFDSEEMYNKKHAEMRRRLDDEDVKELVKDYVGKSIDVVRVCRESMTKAIASGRFDH